MREIKDSRVNINNCDDGFTEEELAAIKRSLMEVAKIKKGELKPLLMDELFDED